MSVELFLELYLTGKKIRSITRHHNRDKMLNHLILLLLLQETHNLTSLAQRLSLALSTTSEKLHHLATQNLVIFKKGQDKRNNHLTLTQSGRQLALDIHHHLNQFASLYTRHYSPQTINRFIDFLKNLQTNLTKGSSYVSQISF